jgi:hypothetical protein
MTILLTTGIAATVLAVCDDPHYQWCPTGVTLTYTLQDDAWTCCDFVNLCTNGDPKRYSVTAKKYTWNDQYGGPYYCVKDPTPPDYANPGNCCAIAP